jgi:hypothetical protein
MLDVLEVIDSLAESPKCAATQIGQEPEALVRSGRNRIVQFQESDTPILSRPTTIKGAIRL